MDLFPDGAPVRLRSRACDMLLHADEDGAGVSLSALRSSPRTSWEARHVERHGVVYVLLQSAADSRYLALCTDRAPPGARGLRAVQSELLGDGVEWTARSAGDGGSDVLLRHPAHGFLCPLGCDAGVGVRQRVNGRSLLARWTVEPAPVAPPQPALDSSHGTEEARGGANQNGLVLSGPPRAPARRRRGRRAQGRVLAPVVSVAGATRGPFWVPLVDAQARLVGFVAQDAVIGLPDVARSGDLEARLGGDLGGAGVVVVLPTAEAVRLAAPAILWQKLRGRHGPRVAVFLPLRLEEGGPAAGGEPDPEPQQEVPLAVQAMMTRLDVLHQGMVTRHRNIRDHVHRLRLIEEKARRGSYDSDTPIRSAVEELEVDVAELMESYNIMKEEAKDLSAKIADEGVNPAAPPSVLSRSPEDFVTPSVLRRLHRRQVLKEEKASKAKVIF